MTLKESNIAFDIASNLAEEVKKAISEIENNYDLENTKSYEEDIDTIGMDSNKKEVICILCYFKDGDSYRDSSVWKLVFLDPTTLEDIDTVYGVYEVQQEYAWDRDSWYTIVKGLWPTKEYAEASHESFKVIKWIEIRI